LIKKKKKANVQIYILDLTKIILLSIKIK